MLLQNCFIMQNLKIMLLPYNGYFSNTFIYKDKHKSCILNKIFMKMERLNLTRISQFFGVAFLCTKTHKPKNWLYNACLDKTFPSSRNASPILIQLSLFYSPLNSCSDDFNHQSLQGKSPSSAGFKSFIFISLPCFSLHPCPNQAITWPLFLLQTFAYCHLVPHVILHLMVYFLLRTK